MEKPIDSLPDLLQACRDEKTTMIVYVGTSNEDIFKLATSGVYKQLWDLFDPATDYFRGRDEGFEKVLSGENAMINAYLNTRIKSAEYGSGIFYVARQTFYSQNYGIVCPSGAPYRIIFENLLIRLVEAGLISKWTNDIIEVAAKRSSHQANKNDPGWKERAKKNRGPMPLSLENLQGTFIILGIGLCIASLLQVTDLFLHYCGFS